MAEEERLAQRLVEVAVGAAADGGQDGRRIAPQGRVEEDDGQDGAGGPEQAARQIGCLLYTSRCV